MQAVRVPDAASEKLQRIVVALVRDPLVRQRIQVDTVLRNRWRDSAVRKIVVGPQGASR
jgi:hypothetical protein